MSLIYFDSSALLSLCVSGPRTPLAQRLWIGADAAITSHVALVQVPAALGQARRRDLLTAAGLERALASWHDVRRAVYVIRASDDLALRAGELVLNHDLRADDAWHLAGAQLALRDGGLAAVWDERLRAAALATGVRVCGQ